MSRPLNLPPPNRSLANLRRGGGGPRGPRKSTRILKDAILTAAERVGNYEKGTDERTGKPTLKLGKDGLTGYLMHMAVNEPKTFGALLGRVLPLQITGEDGGAIRVIDGTMTDHEAAEAYAETLRNIPGLIDPVEGVEIDLDPSEYSVDEDPV